VPGVTTLGVAGCGLNRWLQVTWNFWPLYLRGESFRWLNRGLDVSQSLFGNDDEELLPPRDRELNPLDNHTSESLYGLYYAAQTIKKANPVNECQTFAVFCMLYVFFWVQMEQIVCSETSAYKIQTPGNYPEENTQPVNEPCE
jgi:hypothetical protein